MRRQGPGNAGGLSKKGLKKEEERVAWSKKNKSQPNSESPIAKKKQTMSDGSGDEQIDEREEAEALGRIAHAIACYRSDARGEISRWEASAARLAPRSGLTAPSSSSSALAPLLSRLRAKHVAARAAAERNARWLDSLLEATVGLSSREGRGEGGGPGGDEGGGRCSPYAPAAAAVARSLAAAGAPPSAGDADKVRYVLKNAARDWSASGEEERAASYGRVVEALARALPPGRGTAAAARGEGGAAGAAAAAAGGAGGGFQPPRVLVPGSGLGRLCVDLVAAGYAAQGNEFSYYMLLASAFALNFCCGALDGGGGGRGGGGGEEGAEEAGAAAEGGRGRPGGGGAPPRESSGAGEGAAPPEERSGGAGASSRGGGDPRPTIHPWVLTPCNWLRDADQLAGVRVPDVDPAAVVAAAEEARQRRRNALPPTSSDPPSPSSSSSSFSAAAAAAVAASHRHQDPPSSYPLLSMVAGDFAQVYSHRSREGTFDAVATCFFLDTAHNVLDYIETIKHVLVKNGKGVWVNFGPLLYHWADAASYLPSGEAEETLSLELPLDEVLLAVAAAGFDVVDLQKGLPATFNATPSSMLRSGYACAQWTAVLRKEGAGGEGGMEGVEAKNKE